MKKIICVLLSILLGVFPIFSQTTKITIDAGHPGASISKHLYGTFFEEINHAGEGGLYGELIANRDFEGNRLPEGMIRNGNFIVTPKGWKHYYPQPDSLANWQLVCMNGAKASAKQVSINPLNLNNPMSAQINIEKLDNGEVGLKNSGYWGIPLKKGEKYNLSFYARANTKFKGNLRVSLLNKEGRKVGVKEIAGIGGKWKKFSCQLTSSETDNNGSLLISGLSVGTFWLDVVSMFPENTFLSRPQGLRKDLAEKVAALKPGFLRFPGGCIVEGATLANRVRWENTIGDIAQRPGHWVLWDYHSTDGLGFQEFLQFCEDIHAPAMYVINVGMSCQFRKSEIVDTTQLQPYIHEVMNALEYAIGPVTSKLGYERAKNGHLKPFNLKYIEIGNENFGPVYQQHYNYFYKAIKAKYPQITIIACTDPGMREAFKNNDLAGIKEPIQMIDEHFYESPDFFFKNATRYDSYDRKGPKVYVGEYAVKKWDNSLKGNLEAALAEAAFKTGFERNADIVRLSSLAPTFVNDHNRTWNPDLITYNNHQSFGSPSYQVEKLFSNNIPDRVLPEIVENSGYKLNTPENGIGMVGFSNPTAYCQYKDIVLRIGDTTFTDTQLFDTTTLNKRHANCWIVDRRAINLNFLPQFLKQAQTIGWRNFTLSLNAKADTLDDIDAFSILFYKTGPSAYYQWNIGQWGRFNWLQWHDKKGYESYFGQQPGHVKAGQWYNIKIQVKNDSVFSWLDGRLIHQVKKPQKVTPGVFSCAGINTDGVIILKVVNPTCTSRLIPIDIQHSKYNYRNSHVEVISGNPEDFNSFAQPLKIAPTSLNIKIPGNLFNYQFVPYSVTVIRLIPLQN
jgi:alpha-L-arabinofuranosidase